MTDFLFPSAELVKLLLDPLYDPGVKIATADAVGEADSYIANYVCDDNKTVALCLSDIEMVAYAGSSLIMIPCGGAEDAISDKDASSMMIESYYEVMNILSRALHDSETLHLRLEKLRGPGESVDILNAFKDAVEEVSYTVEIPGYGSGTMTFRIKSDS